MRLSCAGFALTAISLLLSFAGSAVAQDTDFTTGPRYLAIQSSPLFARSISTPSLSLETQMEEPSAHVTTAQSPVEAAIPPAQAQADRPARVDFFTFYYGSPLGQNVGQTAPEQELEPVAQRQTSGTIFETGVSQVLDAHAIRRLGYGATLAEEAARQKSHKPVPPHTYTNEDIERLRQGN